MKLSSSQAAIVESLGFSSDLSSMDEEQLLALEDALSDDMIMNGVDENQKLNDYGEARREILFILAEDD